MNNLTEFPIEPHLGHKSSFVINERCFVREGKATGCRGYQTSDWELGVLLRESPLHCLNTVGIFADKQREPAMNRFPLTERNGERQKLNFVGSSHGYTSAE